MQRNWPALVLLLGCVPGVLFVIAATPWRMVDRFHADLNTYYEFSEKLVEGKLPYRDFPFEYPPLALAPVALPRLVTLGQPLSFEPYRWLFLLQSALCCGAIGAIGVAIWDRIRPDEISGKAPGKVLAVHLVLLTIAAPLLPWRYDLFPAMLTAFALLAMVKRQPARAGMWLGLGIAAKLYPLVLLPIFGLYYLAGREWKSLLRLAAGTIAALVASALPFLLTDPAGMLKFLEYHRLRGIQVESVAGGGLCLGDVLGLSPIELTYDFGAMHVVSPLADAIVPWHLPAFGLLTMIVAAVAYRGFRRDVRASGAAGNERLVIASCAAILAFICTNKVFSPQYIAWLLPLVPLLRLRYSIAFVIVFAATIAVFPFWYDDLLDRRLLPVLLLNLRNLLALAVLGCLVRDLWARVNATGPDR